MVNDFHLFFFFFFLNPPDEIWNSVVGVFTQEARAMQTTFRMCDLHLASLK